LEVTIHIGFHFLFCFWFKFFDASCLLFFHEYHRVFTPGITPGENQWMPGCEIIISFILHPDSSLERMWRRGQNAAPKKSKTAGHLSATGSSCPPGRLHRPGRWVITQALNHQTK
jgi:hypothetical protein